MVFFWDTLVEDVYLALPYYFDSNNGEDRSNMVMNINKDFYALVQAPLYQYNHLKGDFEERGFKPSPLDHCMLYGRGIIALIYVDDVIFFGPYQDNIDEVVK